MLASQNPGFRSVLSVDQQSGINSPKLLFGLIEPIVSVIRRDFFKVDLAQRCPAQVVQLVCGYFGVVSAVIVVYCTCLFVTCRARRIRWRHRSVCPNTLCRRAGDSWVATHVRTKVEHIDISELVGDDLAESIILSGVKVSPVGDECDNPIVS